MRKDVLGSLASAALLLAGCGGGEPAAREAATEQARAVRVVEVRTRPLEVGLAVSGVLAPREEAAVAPELGGYRVAAVLAEEGDRVARGEVLARLDEALLRAQLSQAEAQTRQAEAAAARAGAEAARVAGLDGQGVLAQEQIDQRRFEAQNAEAALAAARAQLEDLRTRRDRLALRAPVAGTVLERNVDPGAIANVGGEPYFRIARGGLIELDAEVPEADLGRIRVGDYAQVSLPTGVRLDGRVRLVSPRIRNENQLGRVRVELPVRPDLRAGGTATATFRGRARPVLAVPEGAIQYTADGATVMVVGRDDRVRSAAVRPGQRAGGYVELRSGPPAGSRVLLGGAAFVLEGDLVRPIAAGAEAGPAGGQGASR